MSRESPASGKLAHAVHSLLLWGLIISCAFLLIGLLLVFWRHEPRPVGFPEAGYALLRHAMQGNGVAILNLGLLILILTPSFRVLVLVIGWSLDRDWLFAAIALCVLILLAMSLRLGVG